MNKDAIALADLASALMSLTQCVAAQVDANKLRADLEVCAQAVRDPEHHPVLMECFRGMVKATTQILPASKK